MNREDAWARPDSDTLPNLLERVLKRLSLTSAANLGLTIGAPILSPAQFFLALPNEPGVLWRAHPESCEVGLGSATVCVGTGPDPLRSIIKQSEISFQGFQGAGLGASAVEPRFFGGFPYAQCNHGSDQWRGFSEAEFTLPRILYRSISSQASLTLFVSRSEILSSNDRANYIDLLLRFTAPMPEGGGGASRLAPILIRRADSPNRENWNQHVDEACQLIARGDLEKVVLAREMLLSCSAAPDVTQILEQLLSRNDGSVCFALRRGSSTFLGATPERLVSRRGSRIVTEALAGSAAVSDPNALQDLLTSDKNQLEHLLVVREIMARLQAIGAEISTPAAPQLRQFGPLTHMHTLLKAYKLGAPHVLVLGEQLHPTPAVGGIPFQRALDFIRTHEAFDRGRYASPVGWFDRNGDGELAVAIRTGLLTGRDVRLYAGAGLVQGSEAGSEWAETELKFQSFLDALGLKTEASAQLQAWHDRT